MNVRHAKPEDEKLESDLSLDDAVGKAIELTKTSL